MAAAAAVITTVVAAVGEGHRRREGWTSMRRGTTEESRRVKSIGYTVMYGYLGQRYLMLFASTELLRCA